MFTRLSNRRKRRVCPYLQDGNGNQGRPVPREGQICTLTGNLPTRPYQGRRCVGGYHTGCALYQATRPATLADCDSLASPPTARVVPLRRRQIGWGVRLAPMLFPILALIVGLLVSSDAQTAALLIDGGVSTPIVLAGPAPAPPPQPALADAPIALPELDAARPTEVAEAHSLLSAPPTPTQPATEIAQAGLPSTVDIADEPIEPQRMGTAHEYMGPPTRIVIPKIKVDSKVIEVGWVNQGQTTVWQVANWAAGFHKNSAYPGQVGNTVLSGHNNTEGEVFRDVHLLHVGDLIDLYVGPIRYEYSVANIFIVPEKYATPQQRRDNAKWIGYFPDNRLTLVTCEPYTTYINRLIVIAHPAG